MGRLTVLSAWWWGWCVGGSNGGSRGREVETEGLAGWGAAESGGRRSMRFPRRNASKCIFGQDGRLRR